MKMRRQKVRAEVEASLCVFRNGDGRVVQMLGNQHLGLKQDAFKVFDLINQRRELNFTEMDMRVKGTGLGVEVIEKGKLVYLNSECLSVQSLIKKQFSVPTRLLQSGPDQSLKCWESKDIKQIMTLRTRPNTLTFKRLRD